MTSLDPSHNPFRTPAGRHAQAVHTSGAGGAGSSKSAAFPDALPDDDGVDDHAERPAWMRRAREEGRQRVQRGMVPVPDLRFEQSYLLSIRPFLHPHPTPSSARARGSVESPRDSKSLVSSADADEVFHWGREVSVDWRAVGWVTVRDQLLSPLLQGALWGWAGLFLTYTASSLRSALYPASHAPRGTLTGGPGGKEAARAGGGAVGGAWWRRFVGSIAGGLETATV